MRDISRELLAVSKYHKSLDIIKVASAGFTPVAAVLKLLYKKEILYHCLNENEIPIACFEPEV